jgi:RNA polymerase sigma factor (sigma-70 family)
VVEPVPTDPRIAQYLPLVRHRARLFARGWVGRSLHVDDLVQIGMTAVWRATQNYDATRGASFGTYVARVVLYAMMKEKKHYARSNRAGVTVSLSAPLSSAADDDNDLTMDLPSREPGALDQASMAESAKAIQLAMSQIDERLRDIIERRFWWEQDLVEIGKDLGVTRERARQLQEDAFVQLRQRLVFLRPVGLTEAARFRSEKRLAQFVSQVAYWQRKTLQEAG